MARQVEVRSPSVPGWRLLYRFEGYQRDSLRPDWYLWYTQMPKQPIGTVRNEMSPSVLALTSASTLVTMCSSEAAREWSRVLPQVQEEASVVALHWAYSRL